MQIVVYGILGLVGVYVLALTLVLDLVGLAQAARVQAGIMNATVELSAPSVCSTGSLTVAGAAEVAGAI